MHQFRETVFGQLEAFDSPYTDEQKLFKNRATFDFESTCVEDDEFKNTETTTWVRKHIANSVSSSSIFFRKSSFRLQS